MTPIKFTRCYPNSPDPWVMVEQIVGFSAKEPYGTRIERTDGKEILVQESPEEVGRRIKQAQEVAQEAGDLPAVASISVISLKPGDIVVVSADGVLSREQHANLKGHVVEVLPPDVKVMVLDRRASLQVMQAEEGARP